LSQTKGSIEDSNSKPKGGGKKMQKEHLHLTTKKSIDGRGHPAREKGKREGDGGKKKKKATIKKRNKDP